MKPFFRILCSSTFIFLNACTTTDINYVARVKLQQLQESDIYNEDKVVDVLFDAEEANSDSLRVSSREIFLKAIDMYKNQKKPLEAIAMFKKSILMLPDAKAYFELGNALMEAKATAENLNEASEAYKVAEKLNFQPISSVYIKRAAVDLAKGDGTDLWQVMNYLRSAFQNGFTDTVAIEKDRYLHTITNTDDYKNMRRHLVAGRTSGEDGIFTLYKNSFPEVNSAFEIGPNDVNMHNYKQTISYEFVKYVPEMESAEFGRNTSNEFYFVAKLRETPIYTALVYASASYFGDGTQPVYTKLVTYNTKGEIIAAKLFAAQISAEKIKTGYLEGDKITIRDYNRSWEQPIDKVSFDDNKVKDLDLVATAVFRLDESGKIVEESVPENFKDSLILAKQ